MTRRTAMLLMISLYLVSGEQSCFVGSRLHEQEATGSCLVQRRGRLKMTNATCAPLLNQGGMYFTTKLCVGTPEQCFDVVADTGSNAVIVPSCVCGETQGSGCAKEDKCFLGANTSSSFQMPHNVKSVFMTFGSGTIETVVATDVVKVGSRNVMMKDGVLLMVNRAGLQLPGEFQGILGLGVPKDNAVMPYLSQASAAVEGGPKQAVSIPQPNDWWNYLCSWAHLFCDDTKGGKSPLSISDPAPRRRGSGALREAYDEKLLLVEAKVDRFSMCFRDGNQSGAMRLGLPPFEGSLQNIGTFHWGLNLQGISVGEQGTPDFAETLFCSPKTMTQDMVSPCGIIPDSGTTVITGPSEQVLALETGICSRWRRCNNHSQGKPSSETFRQLLLDCANWLTTEHGLREIPSIFFHVNSRDGTPNIFELTAWAWVTETSVLDNGKFMQKVCVPSLGSMEYRSQQNGPMWIFGTPLFYEYNVGYDMSTKQISLQRGQCEPCLEESGAISLTDLGTQRRWPRAVQGEPRIPHYDTSVPL